MYSVFGAVDAADLILLQVLRRKIIFLHISNSKSEIDESVHSLLFGSKMYVLNNYSNFRQSEQALEILFPQFGIPDPCFLYFFEKAYMNVIDHKTNSKNTNRMFCLFLML